MFTGFVSLAGVDIVNSPRAATYASQLGITSVECGQCDTLARANWDDPYTSPDADDAPWFDPAVAESKEFAGLVGLEIIGLSKTVAAREAVPLTTDGATLHPLRRNAREIQVRALALAASSCALSYGLSWVSSALRGCIDTAGCEGDALCFFTCCPPGCDPSLPELDSRQPDCCREPGTGRDTCGDAYLRTVYDVGLTEMSSPEMMRPIPGGWLAEVTFTLTAGNPWIFHQPTLLVDSDSAPAGEIIEDYDPELEQQQCTEATDCLQPEDCPPPPVPIRPPLPVDQCFPTGPYTAARMRVALPGTSTPRWAEKVPLITVEAGSTTMRRLIIRWYSNPRDEDCAELDPCAACAVLQVAAIPQGSTLTIDGRSQEATVDCPGGPGLATAEPKLFGRGGQPFVWPLISGGSGMCLEVIAQADSIASDSHLEIYYVARDDAA